MGYIILQLMRVLETVVFASGVHATVSIGGISFFGFTVAYLASAYVFAITAKAGVVFWLAVLAAIFAAVLIGILFALLYRRLSDDSFAVFGVASIFAFDALLRSWESVTGGVLGITGVPRPPLLRQTPQLVWIEIAVAVLVVATEYFLLRAPFGRQLIAHKESTALLSAAGVHTQWVGVRAIILAATLAGISGILVAWRMQYIDPTMGDIYTFIFGLSLVIIAIKPKVSWMLFGSAVVALVPEFLRFLPFPVNSFAYLRVLVYAVIIILLVHRISAKYTSSKRSV